MPRYRISDGDEEEEKRSPRWDTTNSYNISDIVK